MTTLQGSKLSYLECDKGGYHHGEVLNMICLDPTCFDEIACCCACIEQSHKKHNTKPLKMIIKEAQEQIQKIKPTKFNIDVIIDIMQSNQKNTLENFLGFKKQIEDELNKIEKLIYHYYTALISEIKLKNSDPKVQFTQSHQTIYKTKNKNEFKEAARKMITMLPNKDQQCANLTQSQLIESINNSNQQIGGLVKITVDELSKKLVTFQQSLTKQMNIKNIWSQTFYRFSPTFKHPDVKLISDEVAKSNNTSGYKFAVMEPSLEKGSKIKTFVFKIKQCTSNWVAVGMCHQKIVTSKHYAFNFSSIGHGGYLISANGGSWSNTKTEANNAVKAFKFVKGDIIICTFNLEAKKLVFTKKSTKETYELVFEKIPGDDLHPCALFYYVNDEIQFMQKVKQ